MRKLLADNLSLNKFLTPKLPSTFLRALLLLTPLLLSACGIVYTSSNRPPEGGEIVPLQAKLTSAAGEQSAGVGSYCWQSGGGVTECADTIGLPTAQDALPVKAGEQVSFELPVQAPPDDLRLGAIEAASLKTVDSQAAGMRWWELANADPAPIPLDERLVVELGLEPGEYVLHLWARWATYGDVSFGFLVSVQEE